MALTKTKSLSISVVVLSVLLAVALAATIMLAAFSFTAKAGTTLSFASQVSITVTQGLTSNGTWKAKLVSNTGTIGNDVTDTNNITQGVALSSVKVKNDMSKAITVAVAVVISNNGSKTQPALKVGTEAAVGTTALIDSTSTSTNPNFAYGTNPQYISVTMKNSTSAYKWATFSLAASGASGAEAWLTKYINTEYSFAAVDSLAGNGFTATLYFAAVYSDGDIETAIQNNEITSTTWKV